MPNISMNLFAMTLKKKVLIFQYIVQFVNLHLGQVIR